MLFAIRTKLLVLVGLPVAMLAVAVPLLSEAQHDDLNDAADDHVEDAERAFVAEVEDDLKDLEVAARSIAESPRTARALNDNQPSEALSAARLFSRFYPRLDITLAARDGRVLGDVGPTETPASLHEILELSDLEKQTEPHLLTTRGCANAAAHAPPAQAVILPIGELGWVLVCEPLDSGYLENAARKLDAELAFVGPSGLLSSTEHFPMGVVGKFQIGPALVEDHSRVWAVHRFKTGHPDHARGADLTVVAAVDVTKTSASVHRHLHLMLALLIAVAGVAIAVGARIAGTMGRGLRRVVEAYRKLEGERYIHVPVLHTHDEIELLATGFNQMVDGLQERDKLRSTFGKYMTESVLTHLLNGKVELGGDTLKVTILFSDIRSFTTISESMDAHALVALLNEYFTEMVSIVISHGGVVDKYIGDAIMAVFGAPVPTPDDAKNAVRAAVDMRRALAKLNERLVARGGQPLRTGIGIHTGEVVAGNIGSEQRMEYTVIGDPVNVASRLESNTKTLGVDVLISAATYEETKELIVARPVEELTVKGRAEPVMTYAVTGLSEQGNRG
jgi:adenylate cyclase